MLSEKTMGTVKIIVAQRIGTIMDADKIIVLENGEIAGISTHKELLQSCSVYREIAYSQLGKEELARVHKKNKEATPNKQKAKYS